MHFSRSPGSAEETSSTSTADQFFLRHSTVYLIAVKDCLDEHAKVTARFYLAVQRVRAIIDSRELGALKRVEALHHSCLDQHATLLGCTSLFNGSGLSLTAENLALSKGPGIPP